MAATIHSGEAVLDCREVDHGHRKAVLVPALVEYIDSGTCCTVDLDWICLWQWQAPFCVPMHEHATLIITRRIVSRRKAHHTIIRYAYGMSSFASDAMLESTEAASLSTRAGNSPATSVAVYKTTTRLATSRSQTKQCRQVGLKHCDLTASKCVRH
jgi:hypothetical protein